MKEINNEALPEWLLSYPEIEAAIFTQMSQRFGFDDFFETLNIFLADINEAKPLLFASSWPSNESIIAWHSIKGAALTLGFRRLGEWARFMEQTLQDRPSDSLEKNLSLKMFDRVFQIVESLK